MSWRKYFKPVDQNTSGGFSPFSAANRGNAGTGPANSNYSSFLPDVYVGSPNRVERYGQYNVMDLDSEVNAALDILAEFCTQQNKQNNTPFYIRFEGEATNSEVTITQKYLQQWCKLQEFETRMFRIMRNCFKYGDEIFIRDPETKKLYHVDPAHVTRIIVNESSGKTPEQYVIKNFNLNFREMVATTPYETNGNVTGGGSGYLTGGVRGMVGQPNQSMAGSRFMTETNEIAIDAEHVVHLSMSEGLDNNYPFGNSLLETVFKVYKQKELLEDAIIIYRVQRAPERRVFYVDTGNMPSHLAMQFVERVKTQIHQRRIPSKTGGGQNVIDSSYNPLSIQEDFFFPQTCLSLDTAIPLLDGRTLSLQEIITEYEQGKTNWTYGLDNKTHELEPAEIKWAGVTRRNAQVVRVNLDNGESVIATPDHRFITRDGDEVEAQYLKSGDSLMPLHTESVCVASVEEQEYEIDTGDITIESNSDSHWFGLSSGVYVHNSEGRGSKVETLPGGCLAMDTQVSLLDGRELSISEIKNEMDSGKKLWTYSVNPETGEIDHGLISWAGVTQKSAKVMRLTLDNGNQITCTPDHKFPVYGKGFVRADELIETHQIMSQHSDDENAGIIKVKVCEYLNETMEVGTLTIDQDEIYHNYHTFALTAGIFTKNSNLGEIDDLRFFTNKLVRGLRIPSSYLPTGADDGNTQYNDGRVGTAYIQELRFNTYCERLQNMVISCLDSEFKRYILEKGINIDVNMFALKFQPPQNFASYRQSEIDNARVPTYTQMSAIPYISNRFALKRFLGMTDEEIAENERLWREENDDTFAPEQTNSAGEMRGAGITGAGIESDLGGLEDTGAGDLGPETGAEGEGPETATGAAIAPTGAETAETPPTG